MTQMDTVTQSNASNAEESASASEELNAQARELKNVVQDLQEVVGGKGSKVSTAGAAQWNGVERGDESNSFHMKDRIHSLLGNKESQRAAKPGTGGGTGEKGSPKDLIPLEEGEFEEYEGSFKH